MTSLHELLTVSVEFKMYNLSLSQSAIASWFKHLSDKLAETSKTKNDQNLISVQAKRMVYSFFSVNLYSPYSPCSRFACFV
jgi:hypothetical protein